MSGLDAFDADMLGGLYDAAGGVIAWTEALDPLARTFGACSGILYVEAASGAVDLLALPGWSERATRLYIEHYHRLDPYVAFARRHPGADCILGHEVIAPKLLLESPLWQDFGRVELPGFHFIGAIMPLEAGDGGRLAWHRAVDARPFDDADRARFVALVPHLRRALQLHRRLGAAQRDAAELARCLEHIPLGVVVATGDGQVRFANPAAELICRSGVRSAGLRDGVTGAAPAGLRLSPRLHATRAADEMRLTRLLRKAAAGMAGGGVLIGPAVPEARIAVLVCPLPPACRAGVPRNGHDRATGRIPGHAAEAGLAMVTLRPLAVASEIDGPRLRSLFGLSDAEAAVAAALAAGATVAEVAGARHTSPLTVRAQVRQLLAKAEVGSIRDLAAAIARTC